MDVVYRTENSDIATVYIGKFENNRFVEFVESVQPPVPIDQKWVLIVSTLFGCPVGCKMCDAGRSYGGRLSSEQIFSQIDYLISQKFPDKKVDIKKFKIQFSRMGEPAFNDSVLDILENFQNRYEAPGFIPSISTIAPEGSDIFFEKLTKIKTDLYGSGKFQMQFSIHSTSATARDRIIPVKKWDLPRISEFGDGFYSAGDRKITLNFAFSGDIPIESKILIDNFDPENFLVKITPVNPTISAARNRIKNGFENNKTELESTISELRGKGFEVIVSVGELEENRIGSNCGQYLGTYLKSVKPDDLDDSYTYELENLV